MKTIEFTLNDYYVFIEPNNDSFRSGYQWIISKNDIEVDSGLSFKPLDVLERELDQTVRALIPIRVNAHQRAVNDIEPAFLRMFKDLTYGNDTLAIFRLDIPANKKECLILYVDYPEECDRESKGYKRFTLFKAIIENDYDYEHPYDSFFESDNLSDLKTAIIGAIKG